MATPGLPRHRTAIVVTVVIGYLGVAAMAVLAVTGGFAFTTSLPGALGLGAFAAIPPSMALGSLRDRPLMLLTGGVCGLASIVVLSLFGVILALLGVVWIIAYASAVKGGQSGRLSALLVPVLFWAAAGFALLAHIDPVCERTFDDGRTEQYDPGEDGFATGWIWTVDTGSFTGGGTSMPGEVASECTSDRIVWAEALVSMGFSSAAVAAAWSLAPRRL